MASEITVTNTVAFLFPTGAAQPTIDEMASFVKTLVADKGDMEAAYKISEERSVYVKFKTEAAMQKTLLENAIKQTFRYSSGKVVEVTMSVAGGNVRYVRIFDLPPEVNDRQILLVLEKYGKITRVNREKFPSDLGLGNLSTGVRGVHMDIEREIPPILRFAGRKGRLYHEQMTPRCYFCLSEGHFKATCPNKKQKKKNKAKQNSDSHTYANVAGCFSSGGNGDKREEEKQSSREEEEEAAAAVAVTADDEYSETEEIPDEEEMEQEEEEEIDETAVPEDKAMTAWQQIATAIKDFNQKAKEQEQARAAAEQRQQRKKSKQRAGTGSVSPPMKKKN